MNNLYESVYEKLQNLTKSMYPWSDLSMPFIFMTLMRGHKCLGRISDRYLHYLLKLKMLKVLKNAICFILFGCHEINMCINFEINRYKIYSRKHEKNRKF